MPADSAVDLQPSRADTYGSAIRRLLSERWGRATAAARRDVRPEHLAPLLAAATLTFMFVHVVIRRFTYPYELEWMTGSTLDHIERVQTGLPLYAAPTVDWIPFMYPPLYYWLAALVARAVPIVPAARLLSLTCVLIQACCVWRLARWHGATRMWAAIGVGLFFAAFSYTGFWYDLERVDALFVALVAVGTVILCESATPRGAALAGALVGLGFFAKQPAVVFVAAGIVALLIRRERGRALAFSVSAGIILLAGIAWLHATTGGWFSYYVIRMPFAHGMDSTLLETFFIRDLARGYALTVATAAALVALARDRRQNTVFTVMLLAGFSAAASSRLHIGGWDNVLLFWTTFAIPAVAVVCSRIDAVLPHMTWPRAVLAGLVTLQFALWGYDHHALHPRDPQRVANKRFEGGIHILESSGEVLMTGRGHVTSPRHFHMAALFDVIRTDRRVPDAIAQAFAEHRFAHILVDDMAELRMPQYQELDQVLFRAVLPHYYVAARVDDPLPEPVVGHRSRPSLVLRPRTQSLDPADPRMLELHHAMELALAQFRLKRPGAWWRDAGRELHTSEELARQMLLGTALPGADVLPPLPLHEITLPPGFEIDIYAGGIGGARSMAVSPGGVVFVGSRGEGGRVYAIVDRDKDQKADKVFTIARDLNSPNGVAFRGRALYVAETGRVLRYDDIETQLDDPPPPVVVSDRLPSDPYHGSRFIGFGPDGLLYVPVGATCNACEPSDPRFATIMRMKPDGSGLEVFARGIRNTVGFDWHPLTGDLWFTDNGRDLLADDSPPDELNRSPASGLHFGFPYCHGSIPDPELGRARRCSEFVAPVRQLAAHVAALGMRFYTGAMFPKEYRNQVLIAEHGSAHRPTPQGYRITLVRLDGVRAPSYEVFTEGWLRSDVPSVVKPSHYRFEGDAWGRPVDLVVMPDGALLVSDDQAATVYRISYHGPKGE